MAGCSRGPCAALARIEVLAIWPGGRGLRGKQNRGAPCLARFETWGLTCHLTQRASTRCNAPNGKAPLLAKHEKWGTPKGRFLDSAGDDKPIGSGAGSGQRPERAARIRTALSRDA